MGHRCWLAAFYRIASVVRSYAATSVVTDAVDPPEEKARSISCTFYTDLHNLYVCRCAAADP
jgi:hypothetical protein